MLSQAETAKRINCTPTTISIWNRDDAFRVASTAILNEHNDPLVPLLTRALLVKGIQGVKWAAELALRTRGLLDPEPQPGDDGRAGLSAHASVTFVGLPMPPSAAERARTVPPPGSAMILRADGVLEDASR